MLSQSLQANQQVDPFQQVLDGVEQLGQQWHCCTLVLQGGNVGGLCPAAFCGDAT
jgi:DNA-binding transcriptional regulator of glucitol operon